MTVIKKDKDKTISTRKGGIVVRIKKEKKSFAEKFDEGLRKDIKKFGKNLQ